MKVSNPLTIISIFAGTAESFATVALINLPLELQLYFVSFVIFFPIAIVSVFFAILIFKPQVLYAPSDYDDQEHFLHANMLKGIIEKESERALGSIPKDEKGSVNIDWKKVSAEIADSTISTLGSESERIVYEYLEKHPDEFFTPRSLKFILPISRSSATFALYSLESKGLVEKGKDGDIIIWCLKK
jgi:hypothetical protein